MKKILFAIALLCLVQAQDGFLELDAHPHHRFNIEDVDGTWLVAAIAERGREPLYPHHRECENYTFPKLTDKEQKGYYKQTVYKNSSLTHEHKIEYKADHANVWEVEHTDSRIVAHYREFKRVHHEKVLVLYQEWRKHDDDKGEKREKLVLLTQRRDASDDAYEVYVNLLEHYKLERDHIRRVDTQCLDHRHHDLNLHHLEGRWTTVLEAYPHHHDEENDWFEDDDFEDNRHHHHRECEGFEFPRLDDKDEIGEYSEIQWDRHRKHEDEEDRHHHHRADELRELRVRWNKKHAQFLEVEPEHHHKHHVKRDVLLHLDHHHDEQENLVYVELHRRHEEDHHHHHHHHVTVRLMIRHGDRHVSRADIDHFFVVLREHNFHGRIREFREHCKHIE